LPAPRRRTLPQYGLSEVRFYSVPVKAWEPGPASGTTGLDPQVGLSWRPGREAGSHQVWLGTDPNGLTLAATVQKPSYEADVNLDQTCYWQIVEVNAAETPATWPSEVWSFTTQPYQLLDDFESYTDQEGKTVYQTWLDGYADPSNGASTVGLYPAPINGTYCETTIIHAGKQSMPLAYDNTAAPYYSEAVFAFDSPQDWTAHAIKSLSLWFCGAAGNAGQLYVKIDGTKIPYNGEAASLASSVWHVWNIDLSQVGKLNSVRTMTIGIEGPGAKGVLYFDDIRLYPKTPEYYTPVQPATGPVAYWPLNGDYQDASGHGRNGTAAGGPTFATGKDGQAVSFGGMSDYITIDNWQGILDGNPFTISLWVNSTAQDDWTMVCWGGATNGTRVDFRLYQGRLRVEHGNGNLVGNSVVADGQWHHAVLVVTQNASIQAPQVALYVDGLNDTAATTDPDVFGTVADVPVTIGQRRTNNDRNFQGMLDEVRIFDVALSPEEVASLAGRTLPLPKPF